MRIEVTYIDTSSRPKGRGLHLPKLSLPKLHKIGVNKFELRVPRVFIKVLTSAVVLLLLLVGVGIAYTYMDSGKDLAASAKTVAAPTYAAVQPPKISPNAREGVAVEMISSPVSPGSTASISVHTNPTSTCKISVLYNKVAAVDPGLAPKVADDYGSVSWTWTVGSSTPLGTWPVTVTCVFNGRDGVVQGDLEVAK
jgi:hypothetical protein